MNFFHDMKNPGGHGFFKRISPIAMGDLGRRPKTPQPSRRLAKLLEKPLCGFHSASMTVCAAVKKSSDDQSAMESCMPIE